MDVPALQRALAEEGLDGWLLYDFRGQNPTAQEALGLGAHHLTRRWFYLVPAKGEPALLVHAIEAGSFPASVAGQRETYSSWTSLEAGLGRLVARAPGQRRLAMEWFPRGAIPYLSRVDGGTLELVRSLGVDVRSSASLVQRFLARWGPHQLASHVRALRALHEAKDAAFAYVAESHRQGNEPTETQVQALVVKRLRDAGFQTDHPPIVAVNGHAADPHYAPREETAAPVCRGDLLLLDLWAKGPGERDAWADITWVAFCGARPPPKLVEIFRVTREARDVGLALLERAFGEGRALQGWEVDRAVRDHIAAAGYGDAFLHRTGHSIGTRSVHGDGANLDDLETHDTRELTEGLAFSIEPGIYLPAEQLGVRSEIDVVMTAEGPRSFAPAQQELVLL